MERIAKKYVRSVGDKTLASLRSLSEIGVSVCSFLDENAYGTGDIYAPLLQAYKQGKIVVYDTETTGLDLEKDEAIQIAAVKMGEDGILEELNLFLTPTVPLTQGALDTHGFSLEYILERAIPAQDGLQKFAEFAEGCVLVGHNNLAFDSPLVTRMFKDNCVPAPVVLGEYDTLLIAKAFYAGLKNYKLSTLCELFSVVNERAHDAFGDIVATGKCLAKMLEERVFPTALERVDLVLRHREKFEKFFAFYKECKRRTAENDGLGEYIADGLKLKSKYPTYSDGETIKDLLSGLVYEGDGVAFLRNYLRDASLSGSQMDLLFTGTGKIPVVTVHQSKGCEFDTVVVAGMSDGIFPSFIAQGGNMEEEKKVFYVALTRAKKKLVLTRAIFGGRQATPATPFVDLIPEEFVRANRAWKESE
jgi:DNA helicase-2/ATP-dependent DNA helicase PcrA